MSQVQCLHILKKHAGSRRPSSWRQEVITQSKADAIASLLNPRRHRPSALRHEHANRLLDAFGGY
jgi:hypothetical protein